MKNVLETFGTLVETPLVVSVSKMFVYDTLASTSLCPPGQEKLPALIGPAERLSVTLPFLTSKEPPPVTSPLNVCLFAALGFFPPRLMQAYVAVASAVSV